jgi:NAD-dependent deacetylase
MHGDLLTALCVACSRRTPITADLIDRPPCPECGERMLRPDVVWFGEMPYELDAIDEALVACDMFAAIGTSGAVYPAAGFVMTAAETGAVTIELNLGASDITPLFDEVRHGPASLVVPVWVDEVLASRA